VSLAVIPLAVSIGIEFPSNGKGGFGVLSVVFFINQVVDNIGTGFHIISDRVMYSKRRYAL